MLEDKYFQWYKGNIKLSIFEGRISIMSSSSNTGRFERAERTVTGFVLAALVTTTRLAIGAAVVSLGVGLVKGFSEGVNGLPYTQSMDSMGYLTSNAFHRFKDFTIWEMKGNPTVVRAAGAFFPCAAVVCGYCSEAGNAVGHVIGVSARPGLQHVFHF
jgi:hypothetical protein